MKSQTRLVYSTLRLFGVKKAELKIRDDETLFEKSNDKNF